MRAQLRRRYGTARKPTSQPGTPHHYMACEVLAGAYRNLDDERNFLVHTGVFDEKDNLLHVLCKRIPLEHLIYDAGDPLRGPTCPVCAQRLATARARGTALQFRDWKAA